MWKQDCHDTIKNRDQGLLSLISGYVKRQSRHEQLIAQAVGQITEQESPVTLQSHPTIISSDCGKGANL